MFMGDYDVCIIALISDFDQLSKMKKEKEKAESHKGTTNEIHLEADGHNLSSELEDDLSNESILSHQDETDSDLDLSSIRPHASVADSGYIDIASFVSLILKLIFFWHESSFIPAMCI